MMKFIIPVTWSVFGKYKVEATSLKEAIRLVKNSTPPYDALPEGIYINESLVVDMDLVKELNDDKLG
jgi:hypothetical protein